MKYNDEQTSGQLFALPQELVTDNEPHFNNRVHLRIKIFYFELLKNENL